MCKPHPMLPAALLALCFVASACEPLGIKAKITTTKTTADGQTEVKTREAKNMAEFGDAMEEAGGEFVGAFSATATALGSTTKDLMTALVEAPPPGKVRLSDLHPGLRDYESKEHFDFLAAATKDDKAGYDFSYVQVGVPSYDQFFRTAAEQYALAFQVNETRKRMRQMSGAVLGEKVEESTDLEQVVERALAAPAEESKAKARTYLERLAEMHKVLAPNAAAQAQRTAKLVSTGQQLIAGAPASITNPKMALHLDLIVKGIEQSTSLIKECQPLLSAS